MHLFGKANWWLPAWLDRILPRLSIEGAPAPSTARADRGRRPARPADPGPTAADPHRSPHRNSLAIAYLWWFFLGLFGAHHFYLGQHRRGWLYLGTAGLCGLGWLVDPFLLPRQVRGVNARLLARARTADPAEAEPANI